MTTQISAPPEGAGTDAPAGAGRAPAAAREGECWGLLAEFATADELLAAARRVRDAGWRRAEAYTPFPIDGLAEALGAGRSRVPLVPFVTLIGAVLGGLGGYLLQWYAAVVNYPINVGGRPLHSWPMFIPVTFEMTILGGALAAVLALLFGSGLPRLHHPLFSAPDFDLATRDRFFLCLRSDDPAFEPQAAARLLDSLRPLRRAEVRR